MKTMFDKIDLVFVECTTGTCEHVSHSYNGVFIVVAIAFIVGITTHYKRMSN